MTAYAFLGMNGFDLDGPEPDVVKAVRNVVAARISQPKLAEWFRTKVVPLS